MFPTTENSEVIHNVVLHLKAEGSYIPAIRIPTSHIPHYTLKPYKWIAFLGFIIYGRDDHPGFLSTTPDGPSIGSDVMNETSLMHDELYYISPSTPTTTFLHWLLTSWA